MAEIGQVPGGGLPWGGIVKVETPFTDKVTATLLAQQADRKKYQQETTMKADELMNKELANVRSIDMNQVIDSYGKWKNVSMQMLNPRVQNDPKEFNRLQVEKNAALGQTMALINQSAQLNNQAKELVTERKTKPNLYNDDFGDRIAALQSTPLDQIHAHPKYGDLSNPDTYRYQGSQTNFADLEGKAAGKFAPIAGAEKREKVGDLQTRITPTEFGSSPLQFYENYRGQLAQHIPGRDAASAWESIPEQQKAAVDQQFAAISPDKWLAMTGEAKPQVIAAADPNNPAEQFAAYRAKVYAINAVPRAGTAKLETDQAARMRLQSGLSLDRQTAIEALKEGDREKLAGMKKGWRDADQKTKDDVMNGVVESMLEEAKQHPRKYKLAGGQAVTQYEIPASTILQKEFSIPDDKGHPILVDAFRLSEDGKSVTPIFYEPGQTGVSRAVDVEHSKPMTIAEFKARAAKAMFGVKEASNETAGGAAAAPAAGAPASKPTIKLGVGALN